MFLPSLLLVAAIYFQSITPTESAKCINKLLKRRMNDCCNMPQPFPTSSLRECDRKARQSQTASKYVTYNCKLECYFKELGIIDDLSLNMDRVKQHLENVEDRAREFYETAYQTCDDELEEEKDKFRVVMCSPYPTAIQKCVQEKMIQQCPEEYFVESELCDQVKNGEKLCEN